MKPLLSGKGRLPEKKMADMLYELLVPGGALLVMMRIMRIYAPYWSSGNFLRFSFTSPFPSQDTQKFRTLREHSKNTHSLADYNYVNVALILRQFSILSTLAKRDIIKWK